MQSRWENAAGLGTVQELLAGSAGGDTWLLQTRLALLEKHKHTNNAPITSRDSGGETPLASLAAKAEFMGVIFAIAVRGLLRRPTEDAEGFVQK